MNRNMFCIFVWHIFAFTYWIHCFNVLIHVFWLNLKGYFILKGEATGSLIVASHCRSLYVAVCCLHRSIRRSYANSVHVRVLNELCWKQCISYLGLQCSSARFLPPQCQSWLESCQEGCALTNRRLALAPCDSRWLPPLFWGVVLLLTLKCYFAMTTTRILLFIT